MSEVELTASSALHVLHEFEKAELVPGDEKSKQTPEKRHAGERAGQTAIIPVASAPAAFADLS